MLLSIFSLSFSSTNGIGAAAASYQFNQSAGSSSQPMVSSMAGVADFSGTAISVVQSGSASTSNVTLGEITNPIGTNVSVDVRIDNVSVGFWGWSVATVTWNPTVMNLTKVQKGPFLSDNTGGDTTLFLYNSNLYQFNWNGILTGGLSEGIAGSDISTDSSGVLATLTFLVTGSGNSMIGITGGNLRLTSSDSTGVNVVSNNATINVLSNNISPTPTGTPSPTPTPLSTSTTSTNPTPTPTSSQSPTNQSTANPTPTPSVPEFPSWIIIPAFIIPILTSLAYLKRKKTKRALIFY